MASLSHAPSFANPNNKQSSTLHLPSSLPMNPSSLLPLHQFEPWLAHLEKPHCLSHNMHLGSLDLHETSYPDGLPGDSSQDLIGRDDPLLTSSWEALDKLVSASISTGSMNEVSDNTINCVMGKGGNNVGSSPSFSEVEQKPLNLYNTSSSNKLSSSSNGGIMWVPTSHANASSIANSNVGLNLASLISADPGFAERAAKFSSYSQQVNQAYSIHNVPSESNLAARKLTRMALHTNKSSASNSPLKANHVVPVPDMAMENASSEGAHKPCLASKNEEDPPPQGSMANHGKKKRAGSKDVDVDDQGNGKRPKTGENVLINEIKPTFVMKPQQSTSGNSADSEQKSGKEISKSSDAPKPDFIHVRARRGQATDSHSLAERVRREKISERMKYLQDLVPGCSKVTGKAMMLDEIINYVQSLQRQVEFLSMKLAAVHPSKLEFNLENLFGKEVAPPISQNHNNVAFAPETNTNSYPFVHDSMHLQVNPSLQLAGNPPCTPVVDLQSFGSDASLRRTVSSLISSDTFGSECISQQITEAWDDDLQNIVQMGFAQTPLMPPNLQGPLFHGQMKAEL